MTLNIEQNRTVGVDRTEAIFETSTIDSLDDLRVNPERRGEPQEAHIDRFLRVPDGGIGLVLQ